MIGGNTNNYFAPNEDEAEQWYAIDDLIVKDAMPNAENLPVIRFITVND